MNIKKYWMMLAIALVSLSTISCGGDDDTTDEFPVNNQVNTAIKTVFPKARLDSISSYTNYGNIKIKYNGDYLTEYGEYYDNGKVHDGLHYRLKWNKNEVEFYHGKLETPFMKVILGSNGFAKECLNTDGSVRHTFEYDEEGHLVKYNEDDAASHATPDYWVCQWENGNMVKATHYFYKTNNNSSDGYCEYYFTYSSIANTVALLPALRGYDWLQWAQPDYLTAMHYAGLLGKGTKNLVSASSNRWENGQSNQKYSYQYKMSNGFVISCSDGYKYDYFFYTNISNN